MVWFLGGTAVLCLLYYIIIVIYSGVSTSFALIWPCLAIFLGLLAAGWWFGSQHEGRIPVWIGVSVGTVCAAGFLILVITEVLIGWSAITATGQPGGLCDRAGSACGGAKISNSLKAASGSGDRVFGRNIRTRFWCFPAEKVRARRSARRGRCTNIYSTTGFRRISC